MRGGGGTAGWSGGVIGVSYVYDEHRDGASRDLL